MIFNYNNTPEVSYEEELTKFVSEEAGSGMSAVASTVVATLALLGLHKLSEKLNKNKIEKRSAQIITDTDPLIVERENLINKFLSSKSSKLKSLGVKLFKGIQLTDTILSHSDNHYLDTNKVYDIGSFSISKVTMLKGSDLADYKKILNRESVDSGIYKKVATGLEKFCGIISKELIDAIPSDIYPDQELDLTYSDTFGGDYLDTHAIYQSNINGSAIAIGCTFANSIGPVCKQNGNESLYPDPKSVKDLDEVRIYITLMNSITKGHNGKYLLQ